MYDCSCKISSENVSLNDCLRTTTQMLNDLSLILIRFRLNRFGITTDIEKSIPTCSLFEEDTDVKRFLWLNDPSDVSSQITTYRFKAVLFGATCSPFILNATLLKTLTEVWKQNGKITWTGSKRGNILTSVSDEDDALTYFRESRSLMNKDFHKHIHSYSTYCLNMKCL